MPFTIGQRGVTRRCLCQRRGLNYYSRIIPGKADKSWRLSSELIISLHLPDPEERRSSEDPVQHLQHCTTALPSLPRSRANHRLGRACWRAEASQGSESPHSHAVPCALCRAIYPYREDSTRLEDKGQRSRGARPRGQLATHHLASSWRRFVRPARGHRDRFSSCAEK